MVGQTCLAFGLEVGAVAVVVVGAVVVVVVGAVIVVGSCEDCACQSEEGSRACEDW